MSPAISEVRIAVLNFNGLELLKECLPSIVEAARCARRKTAITVLDNQSTDGSVDFLKAQFPSVDIIQAPVNRILFSYNDALKKIHEEIVILLNNDIRVDKNFVDPLVGPFEKDDTVFAVGVKSLDFDGRGYQGEKSIAGMRWGIFWTDSRYPGYQEDMERPSWTAQVALGAFNREKFLELGGYDDLYFPGIWEDTDISFRSYQHGWHCLYEPKSVIYHKGQVTFHREYGSKERAIIAYRNTFLFMWKNIRDPLYLLEHFLFLLPRIIWALLKGQPELGFGFIRALGRLPMALSKRRRLPPVFSERDIFHIFKRGILKGEI